jgi:hypothetical protein
MDEVQKSSNVIALHYCLMMISGATAQTGPWPPFTGFMCGVISSTIELF